MNLDAKSGLYNHYHNQDTESSFRITLSKCSSTSSGPTGLWWEIHSCLVSCFSVRNGSSSWFRSQILWYVLWIHAWTEQTWAQDFINFMGCPPKLLLFCSPPHAIHFPVASHCGRLFRELKLGLSLPYFPLLHSCLGPVAEGQRGKYQKWGLKYSLGILLGLQILW